MSNVNVTTTMLKWTARSLKQQGLHGCSGKTVIANAVRAKHPHHKGSDDQVIAAHFATLNKPSVPVKSPTRTKAFLPKTTERSSDWAGTPTPAGQPPWGSTIPKEVRYINDYKLAPP